MKVFSFENVSEDFRIVITDKTSEQSAVRTVEIEGSLREPCAYCGTKACNYNCDESSSLPNQKEDEARERYNNAMLGIESLLLTMAAAGVDLGHRAYRNAVEVAIERCMRKVKENDG